MQYQYYLGKLLSIAAKPLFVYLLSYCFSSDGIAALVSQALLISTLCIVFLPPLHLQLYNNVAPDDAQENLRTYIALVNIACLVIGFFSFPIIALLRHDIFLGFAFALLVISEKLFDECNRFSLSLWIDPP